MYKDLDWDYPFRCQLLIRPESLGSEEIIMTWGRCIPSSLAGTHVGFRSDDGTIYGTVGDGSSESIVEIKSNISEGVNYYLEFVYQPSEYVEFRTRNDPKARLTSNLPSGSTGKPNQVPHMLIQDNAGSDKEVKVGHFAPYRGLKDEIMGQSGTDVQ